MFNCYLSYTVGTTVYLDKIFTRLPANAFINKGRCGIGATSLELWNLDRCSIIVAPTKGILKDKLKSHPNLFVVDGDVTPYEVREQLAFKLPAQKIMSTPEGIKKVIDAAEGLGMLDDMYRYWFLVLDECHTFASEDFRKDILRPFDYFWNFANKCLLSATPYYFSDKRFSSLDHHEIKFTSTLGKITLVDCKSVFGTLNQLIIASLNQPGRLHIFLNSVTEIRRAAENAGLTDFHIYCADGKDNENMTKLGPLQKHYVEQPDKDNFAKVNFYTSKYFEGWDMFDEDATIVMVSDINKLHTKVSVGMKLKQAAGRLRKPSTQIIHLTNHHNNWSEPKSLAAFQEEYYRDAEFLLDQYAYYLEDCKIHGRKPKVDPRIEKYADIEDKTKAATLNTMKLDQQINQAYSHEMYNNINLIKNQWEEGYYEVEARNSNHLLETNTTMKRKSKAQQLKEDYLTILNFKQEKASEQSFYFNGTPEDQIKATNPLAYQASQLLDRATIESLQYNVKKVLAHVIATSNERQEVKLLRLLNQEFKQGDRYTIEIINAKLHSIYTRLDIRNPKTGLIKVPLATQLREAGKFDIKACKIDNNRGGYENGYLIERAQFNLRVAA
jgi:hypothetical protein